MTSEDIFFQPDPRMPTCIGVWPLPKKLVEALNHPTMTLEAKRALLASWASDAHAIEDAPSLRRLDDGSVIDVDELLRALNALDGDEQRLPPRRAAPPLRRVSPGRRRDWSRWIARVRRDDDDDPPPSPVCAAIPPRTNGGGAFSLPEPEAA
ncbi:hypothetical protein [Mesorhizobium sp. ES1-4]|uniref:hypothetical protein n=1 Tax=Mesorhizobium sp. ES1-4 TaxID=2876627 RepID=UPI001CCA1978|nr:hypothetical protein [Mesorhizobium sp. ES1-4]MBZ9799008.1 hypothetical protein [Mesorhizobium sp. ES1-4]